MAEERILSIVLGPPPSYRNPITREHLRSLEATRSDIEVQVGQTGTRAERDLAVIDPTGKTKGKLTLMDGRLQIRNPDDGTIEWMLERSKALDGRVVDSTRRTYRTLHDKYIHPDDLESRRAHAARLRSTRNKSIPFTQTIVRWSIVGLLAAVSIVILLVFDK